MEGASARAWLDRLETEHDNLRVALTFSRETPGHADAALRIASGMQRLWEVRGYLSRGGSRSRRHWRRRQPARRRCGRMHCVHWERWRACKGDYAAANSALRESLHTHRENENKPGIIRTLGNLGVAVYAQGDYAGARSLFEEALELQRETNEPHRIASLLGNLGVLAREQGDLASARALFEEAVPILRRPGTSRPWQTRSATWALWPTIRRISTPRANSTTRACNCGGNLATEAARRSP
jgi:tetratricopeptide (TPR) repeat protein